MGILLITFLSALQAFAAGNPEEQSSDQFFPEWLSPTSNIYNPGKMADPFVPFVQDTNQDMEHETRTPARPLTPLEKIQLEQLNLVGIIWTEGQPQNSWAMVELPDGKGFILEQGSVVGPNQGKVIAIVPNGVFVMENVANSSGVFQDKQTVLRLNPGQED
jgi:type IV pilus assembly protein PilP